MTPMLKPFLHLPKTTLITGAAYLLCGCAGLAAAAAPENAGGILGGTIATLGLLLGGGTLLRGAKEQRLQSRLDHLTEQHALLSEDVARWHRRARQAVTPATAPVTTAPVAVSEPETAAAAPAVVAFPQRPAKPAQPFDEAVIRSLLQDALRKETLDIVVQPVMRLPQRRPAMLEILARLPGGKGQQPITAGRFLPHLKEAKKVPVMDRLALQYCFNLLTDHSRRQHDLPYILNIQPETFRDADYMGKLLSYLRGSQTIAPRLIFEMSQNDYRTMTDQVRSIADALAGLGCRFSMDHVDNPQFTRTYLQDNHIAFVKLSGARLAQMARSICGVETVQRIKDNLARHGVALVAEGIEEEHILMDILDLGLDYGQGFLFGQPVAPIIRTRESLGEKSTNAA